MAGDAGASMGPRSVERGNRRLIALCLVDADGLQWGRVRLNAETGAHTAGDSRYGRLQWGRVRLNAETCRRSKHSRIT